MHVDPSVVSELNRPNKMVTEHLKLVKINLRTLQTFFLYSAPQEIKTLFEVTIKAASCMYEAVAIAGPSFHIKCNLDSLCLHSKYIEYVVLLHKINRLSALTLHF